MNEIENYNEIIFEKIKHIDENGNEYWEARELMKLLEYDKWEEFHKVIKRAMTTCKLSNIKSEEQFIKIGKMIKVSNGTIQTVEDYKLSRYACYIIVQNADPKLKNVAIAQNYIVFQTRRFELKENNELIH